MSEGCWSCPSKCLECSSEVCLKCANGAALTEGLCVCTSGYEDNGQTCTLVKVKVSYSISVTKENEITLTFSSIYNLTAAYLKIEVDGVVIAFNLEQSSPTEFILYLADDSHIDEGTLVWVTILVEDDSANVLESNTASGTLHAQAGPISNDRQIANALSSATQTALTVAVITISVTGLSTGNMSSTWSIIGSIQLLGYVPMMGLDMPLPLTETFKSMLFSFLPNTFQFFVPDQSSYVHLAAKRVGADSSLYLLNAGELMTVFLGTLTTAPVIYLFTKFDNFKVASYFSEKLASFKWNFFIRFSFESYIDILFACYLQFYDLSLNSIIGFVSSALSVLVLGIYGVVQVATIVFTYRNHLDFESNAELKQKYGSVFDEFNKRGFKGNCYYSLFLARRVVYMSTLFLLTGYQWVQIILNICHSISVRSKQFLFFVLLHRPYATNPDNFCSIFSEFVISLVFILIGLFYFDLSSTASNLVMWFIVGLLYSIMLVNISISSWKASIHFRSMYAKWKLKRNLNKEKQKALENFENLTTEYSKAVAL